MTHGRCLDPNSTQGRMRSFLIEHYVQKNKRPKAGELTRIARVAGVRPDNFRQAARQIGLGIDRQD